MVKFQLKSDWWNYDYIVVHPGETAIGIITRKIDHTKAPFFRNIFWDIIERPPQWHIDQNIKKINDSIENNQRALLFWEGL